MSEKRPIPEVLLPYWRSVFAEHGIRWPGDEHVYLDEHGNCIATVEMNLEIKSPRHHGVITPNPPPR